MSWIYFFKFPLQPSLGGAELHTLALAQNFWKQGFKVKLIASDGRLFRLFEKNCLPRRRMFAGFEPTAKWSLILWPITYVIARIKFKRLLKEIPAGSILYLQSLIEKLVLTPMVSAPSSSPPREGGERVGVIWLEHKIPGRWLTLNPLKFQYLKLARQVRLITVSNFAKREFVKFGVPGKNIKVIYPGFAIHNSSPPPLKVREGRGELLTIGILSRLSPEKGVLDFVRLIIPELKARPDWRVLIAGEGRDEKNIQSIIDNNNLKEQIKHLGFVNNLDEFFAQISVLVYPTKAPEAFGIAVMEAQDRGIPVIASNLGALPEIVNRHQNGFLVNPSSPASWKHFLEMLARQ
mgnify:FL=1